MLSSMTITTIQQQLTTPEGFSKAVSPKRAAFGGAVVSLVLSLIGLGMNTFQLGSASGWDWKLIERYFLTADAIEFTGSRSGRAEFFRFLYVYGPIVLIPLAIILFIVHFATRGKAASALYSSFQERGWVGRQLFPGLTVKNGNANVTIALVSHPSIPEEEFTAIVQRYAQYLGSLDKKGLKAVSAAAVKQKVLNGASASVLSPEIPAAIVATPAQGKGEFVAVVPPDASGKGKLQVLPIKA